MAAHKRQSTVHDLASLRLHPDGSRVNNNAANTRPRRSKYAAQDPRGNWIARDAGGLGVVKKRRSARLDDETIDVARASATESVQAEDAVEDRRAQKRRRFDRDLHFLVPSATPAVSVAGDSQAELPTPSSDLLKCIHYFASTYYSEMGQLYDASKEARREKKRRRLERLKQGTAAAVKKHHLEAHDKLSESEGDSSSKESVEGALQRESRAPKKPVAKDMYKIFDGSALMAIGMLFQEHVSHLVSTPVPDKWEEEMLAQEQAAAAPPDKKRKKKGRPRQSDEVEQELSAKEGSDSDSTVDSGDDRQVQSRRETRGVQQPAAAVPYDDNDTEDEDFVP